MSECIDSYSVLYYCYGTRKTIAVWLESTDGVHTLQLTVFTISVNLNVDMRVKVCVILYPI
jgi:hypothetical protein